MKRRRVSMRRRLGFQSLEDRRLLAVATDLTTIRGRIFDDFSGDGFTEGEQVAGVSLDLYRGDGNAAFEPGAGESLVSMVLSDAQGIYEFPRVTAGQYFVLQRAQTASGRTLQRAVSPPIVVTDVDVAGRLLTTIDSFSETTQSVRDETNDGIPVTRSVAAAEAIGGFRDLVVSKTSVNGAVELIVNSTVSPDFLTVDSVGFGDGERRIIWDGGGDDEVTVNDDGFAATDLTSGGAATGVRVVIGADLAGGRVAIRLYTDDANAATANRFSAVTLAIPALNDRPTSVEYIPFTQFTAGGDGAADLTRIGAIEMEILGLPNYDALADLVGAIGPTIKTQDFDNFETADLQLTKTLTTTNPRLNDPVTFAITVTNSGPGGATNIVVVDTLPVGITYLSNITTTGTFEPLAGRWTIPTLAANATATLTLTGTLTSADAQINTAQIFSVDQFDPNSVPGNGVPTEDDQSSVVVDVESADLSLTKAITSTTTTVGENVTFVVTLDNAGPDAATGVVVRDSLPDGLIYVSDATTFGTYDSATGLWTIGDVAVGGSVVSLTIVARIDTPGNKVNTATVIASDQPDPDSTPNAGPATEDDTATVTLSPATIDLQLTKTVLPLRPTPTDVVTTTLTINNVGAAGATGVQVRDLLPRGLIFQSASPSSGSYSDATGIWSIGEVAAASQQSITILSTLDPNRVTPLSPIVNIAEVIAADQFDIDSTPANNLATEDDQATATITPARADLSLTKTVAPVNPNVGDNVTFTVTVRNAGPDASGALTVSDPVPSGATFVSAEESIGTYDPATGIWSLPGLAVSESATLQMIVQTTTPQLVANIAQVQTASLPDPNSTPGNDVPGEDDQATASVSSQQIDLALTKTVDVQTPRLGQTVTFTVTVANNGVSDATGVVIEDRLPAGLTLLNATPDRGSFNTTTRRWTLGSLAAGATASIVIRARVEPSVVEQDGTAINVAEVFAADQVDLNSTPNNNVAGEDDQASVTIRVPVVNISLVNTVDNPTPNVGDVVAFEVVVANAGPDDATGLVIRDTLPVGVTIQSNTLTAGQYDPVLGTWSIATLAAGQNATLTLFAIVGVSAAGGGPRVNLAELIALDQDDSNSTPNNNVATEDDQDTAEVRVPVIDLSLTQSVAPMRPSVGRPVTLTLTVRNDGPDAATGVVVASPLPAGLTFVSSTPTGVYSPTTGQWIIGGVAAGESTTLELVANVTTPSPITIAAEITAADQFDIDSTPASGVADGQDDTASVILTPASADLSLTKAVDNDRPNRGGDVVFTLSLRNDGPDPASNVVVRDVFPVGLTLNGNNASTGTFDSATRLWTIPTIGVGQTVTLTLRATVGGEVAITNTAEVIESSERDPDSTPGNGDTAEDDFASVTLTPQLVDLALTKAIDEPRPNLGQTITYTIIATNDGPSDATGVRVADRLPAGLVFVNSQTSGSSGPATGGGYSESTGVWTIARLPAGQTATLTLQARVAPTTLTPALADGITNTAEIIAIDQPDRDSTPNNQVATEDDIASVTLTLPRADISLEKSVDVSSPDRGQLVAFTVTLTNGGPDTATNVVVQDLLPVGLRLESDFQTAGTYDRVTGRWAIDQLAPGNSATLQLTATVIGSGATTGGRLTNIAEVISVDQLDPDSTPGNGVPTEDDFALIAVEPRVVDISLSGIVDNPEPLVGEVITITVTASNAPGPGIVDATGVVVRTLIPDAFTLLAVAPEQGQYDPLTGRWEIGTLAAGQSFDLVFTARVNERGVRTQVAEVIAVDQFDRDSDPNNGVPTEDDQIDIIIRAPRLLTKRLFLSR